MHVDESSSVCSGIRVTQELAGTPGHDGERAKSASLEKIIGVCEVNPILKFRVNRANTIIPTTGAYHHIVVGQNDDIASRLLQAGAVVPAHRQRFPHDAHNAKISAVQLMTADIVFVGIQHDFDTIETQRRLPYAAKKTLDKSGTSSGRQ
jgi:hypothetical protein